MNHTSGFFELVLVAVMVAMVLVFASGKSCSQLLNFSSAIQIKAKK